MSNTDGRIGFFVVLVLLGGLAGWLSNEVFDTPEVVEPEVKIKKETVTKELSEEEIDALCGSDEVQEKQENVLDVQNRVKSLQQTLAEKEAELKRLRKESKKNEKAKKAAMISQSAIPKTVVSICFLSKPNKVKLKLKANQM